MYSLIVFVAGVAAVAARPGQLVAVSQDTLGNYNLKYAIEGISRTENRDILGNVNGGFSYIDPYGQLRKTEFTSGVHGYNPISSDIPLPVSDTPEVALAKAQHLAVLRAAELAPKIPEFQVEGPEVHPTRAIHIATLPTLAQPVHIPALPILPQPIPSLIHLGSIPDTPEVIAARAEHLAAHAAARANLLLH